MDAIVTKAKRPAGKAVTGQMPSDKLDLTIIKADYRAQPRENLITDVVRSYAFARASHRRNRQ